MYYQSQTYPWQYPNHVNVPTTQYERQPCYGTFPNYVGHANGHNGLRYASGNRQMSLRDYGPNPFAININEATKQNNTYRTALWTGEHLQVTLMSIDVGDDIGLEVHPDIDQFLRIEDGQGLVQMGKSKNNLTFRQNVFDDSAIMVPAGTWHNVTNTGNTPLKLYSIYTPPNHPFGTVHVTKADAIAQEDHRNSGTKVFGKTPDE